jgi:outer membrane protein OmpA-like peptidoglycan-associated protein
MNGLPLLLRSVGVAGLVLALSACQTPPPAPAPAPYSGPVLPIEQSERGVQIFLPNSVLFEVGKSALSLKDSGPYLDRVADLLKNKTKNAVSLEGHADSTGSATLNQSLSEDRARAVAVALTERGVPKERLQTAGFSFNRPVASNTTEDGRKLNRRVEVVILDEKVENITQGEPANAFSSAWAQLKSLIDQGLVKPAEK